MGNFYNFKTFPYLGKLQDFSHLGKIHFDQNWGVLPYSLGLYLTELGRGWKNCVASIIIFSKIIFCT
jgi:hypothetical protein